MYDPGSWFCQVHPHSKKCKIRDEELAKPKSTGRERIYRIWYAMRYRCERPGHKASKWYYDKGIRVANEWRLFEAFYEWAMLTGYDDSLTLDRRDSRGHYCPENCRWLTRSENTRRKHFRPRRVLSKRAYTLV
jgi:hypothetical protein